MSLKFTEENSGADWDKFISENNGDFLQSWAWGEMQKSEGSTVKRYKIRRNDAEIAAFQAYKQKTRLGEYAYIPRGPIFQNGQKLTAGEQKELSDFLKKLFPDCIFILLEPLNDSNLEDFPAFNNLQPKKTLQIDLTKPIEQIYKDITNSRRQGIILSPKKGVLISNANSPEYFEIFDALVRKTGARQGFGIFGSEHYKNILKFMPAEIFLAKLENNSIAAAEIIFWGDTATYLHAGSDGENKHLRAPDLLIWKIIEDAKNHGFKKFDFWGIDENRFPGVTFFKKSFGGYEVEYGKARIIVNNRIKFLIYDAYRRLRKML